MSRRPGEPEPPYVEAMLGVCATLGFLASYFRIGDSDLVFWVAVTFNVMLTASVMKRT